MDTTTDHFTPLALRVRGNYHFTPHAQRVRGNNAAPCFSGSPYSA